jgi:hypothetical protein
MVDLSRMPIESTVPPSAVAKQPNGAVDEALLDLVDDRKDMTFKLATLPARGMIAMHAAIKRELGVTLSSTGRGRTLAGQWEIFGGKRKRYEPCSEETFVAHTNLKQGRTKRFPAADRAKVAALLGIEIPEEEFWTKIPNGNGTFPAMAAVPGKSPHGLWCADDLALPGNKNLTEQIVHWLFANELAFGFAHSTKTEVWHVQWFVGDTVPQAVLEFEVENPFVGNGLQTLGRDQRLENDMVKAIKAEGSDAIFTAAGILVSWVADPADYEAAVAAGLAPPAEQIETVPRATLGALRLVGAMPPGFQASEFQEVVDEHPDAPTI